MDWFQWFLLSIIFLCPLFIVCRRTNSSEIKHASKFDSTRVFIYSTENFEDVDLISGYYVHKMISFLDRKPEIGQIIYTQSVKRLYGERLVGCKFLYELCIFDSYCSNRIMVVEDRNGGIKHLDPRESVWIAEYNLEKQGTIGELHKKNGKETIQGATSYYKKGVLHREDGPAVESTWINTRYIDERKVHGKHYSVPGDFIYVEYWRDGVRHRRNGPAIIGADGREEYWINGVQHRTDGPAIKRYSESGSSYFEWWVGGIFIYESIYCNYNVKEYAEKHMNKGDSLNDLAWAAKSAAKQCRKIIK